MKAKRFRTISVHRPARAQFESWLQLVGLLNSKRPVNPMDQSGAVRRNWSGSGGVSGEGDGLCSRLQGGLPRVGEKFVEAIVWCAGDAGDDVAEVGEGVDYADFPIMQT